MTVNMCQYGGLYSDEDFNIGRFSSEVHEYILVEIF